MSLNHITSTSTYNPWMNINANDIKCKTISTSTQPYIETSINVPFAVTTGLYLPIIGLSTVSSTSGITYNALNGEYKVSNAGIYIISYSVTWDQKATGAREVYIYFNDGALNADSAINNVTATVSANSSCLVKKLIDNQTFEVRVFQSSGGNVNINEVHINVVKMS